MRLTVFACQCSYTVLAGFLLSSTLLTTSSQVWAQSDASSELLPPPPSTVDGDGEIGQTDEAIEGVSPLDEIQIDGTRDTGGMSPLDEILLDTKDIPPSSIEEASDLSNDSDSILGQASDPSDSFSPIDEIPTNDTGGFSPIDEIPLDGDDSSPDSPVSPELIEDVSDDGDTAAEIEEEIAEDLPDRGLVAPPVDVPDDPQDITTPEAPPLLDIPADPPPIQVPNAAETLELPTDPLEVRVESIQGLTLDEALDIALDKNPTIRQAELDVEIARKQVSQARGEYYPELSTQVNYTYQDPASPDRTGLSFLGTGGDIQNFLSGNIRL